LPFPDAFQRRAKRPILARYYADYSMETFEQLYDKAGQKVLE